MKAMTEAELTALRYEFAEADAADAVFAVTDLNRIAERVEPAAAAEAFGAFPPDIDAVIIVVSSDEWRAAGREPWAERSAWPNDK
jgi:hypothetical protein